MKIYLLIFISFYIFLAYAQSPDTAWTKTYHRGSDDDCKWIEETSDSGFVMIGLSHFSGNSWSDILLIKTNELGDILWTHTYGDSIIGQEVFCVKEDFDGGFVIAGIKHLTSTLRKAWIIKTDSIGDTLWTYMFGGTTGAEAQSISCTSDSGYIITGKKYDPGEFANVFLLKLDQNGEFEWVRTFGGGGYEEGYLVQQTSDGGYLVGGSIIELGGFDFYLIKTNSLGIAEWSNTYGGEQNDHCTSALQTNDGGYLMFGESDSYIANSSLAIKTNSSGDSLWSKVFKRSNGDYGYSVEQTTDNGFIFGGYTNNPGMLDDYWFIRTDNTGDTLWMKSVGYGGTQRGYCVHQTIDGGYILAGTSSHSIPNGRDFYVVKLNPSVTDIDDGDIIDFTFNLNQNYPNPFNPSTTISWQSPVSGWQKIKVFDVLGNEVATLVDEYKPAGSYEVEFLADKLASGIYFYQLKAGGFVETKKMILIK